jgi:hypothetical protein
VVLCVNVGIGYNKSGCFVVLQGVVSQLTCNGYKNKRYSCQICIFASTFFVFGIKLIANRLVCSKWYVINLNAAI